MTQKQHICFWMAVAVLVLLLFGGCKSVRYVPVQTVKTDSLYLSVHYRDSIHVHDSIYVRDQGDTVTVDRWHTVYRDRMMSDTMYIERIDSVQVPFPVEKKLTWWQNTKLGFGEFSIGIILVLLIVIVFLMKKGGVK